MSDAQDQYRYYRILYLTDYTPVADAIFPELTQSGTMQSLADLAWIIKLSDSFM